MGKFKEYNIGNEYEVVVNLASYLAEDHLCKQLEKIVSELDISELEASYSHLGQKALDPRLMLSVIFYGYIEGIRTGRKLAKACRENLAFIYLSKGYSPRKSALNDFRKNHYDCFTNLFKQVLAKCMEQECLKDSSLIIADGSKVKANSSKRRTKNQEQYERWEERLLEDISSLKKEYLDSQKDSVKKN